MLKKASKKTLKRKADAVFSKYIRSRNVCQWCGAVNDTLQCCHIFSRRFLVTRWDEFNALCLDARCHFKAHQQPIEFTEFIKKFLGESRYNALRRKAKTSLVKQDLQVIITKYQRLLDNKL